MSPALADSARLPDAEGVNLWATRVAWFLLPLTVGPALAAVLGDRSSPVRAVTGGAAWSAWVVALVALLVAHPIGLTVLRVVAPLAGVVAVGAALAASSVPLALLALAGGAAAAVTGLSAMTSDRCVDGASYGPERRMALRIPLALLLGPLPLAWSTLVGGALGGPLLLAAGRPVPGVVATVLGAPAAVLAARSVHSLSVRFVVFVPAGLVLRDPTTLNEPVLFRRDALRRVGPAEVGTTAADLTAGATGLVVELELARPQEIIRRTGRRAAAATSAAAVLITPVRPGALLREARQRSLPVR